MTKEDELRERIRRLEADVAGLTRETGYLRRALFRRAESLPVLLPKFFRPDESVAFDGKNEKPVDIVLTVRDTYDFLLPCVESIFANTDVPFRLFLNDNGSVDQRTPSLLRRLQDEHSGVVKSFFQKEDLGFPDAVNLLLRETSNDVILVNADTVLPPFWAGRLMWYLRHSGVKVASAAPFSTASSFSSFPDPRGENDLFGSMAADALDRVFQKAKPTAEFAMPFSPGFCMALSRRALDEIGLLDAKTFRPGYGEEADWCYRATGKGYRHLLAVNLFVFHKHGVTFKRQSSTGRERLLRDHEAILARRYPGYFNDGHDFIDNPAYRSYCDILIMLAAIAASGATTALFTSYDHLTRVGSVEDADALPSLFIARHPETGEYFLRFKFESHLTRFTAPSLNWVMKLLYRIAVRSIRFDDSFLFDDREKTLRAARRFAEHAGVAPEPEELFA